MRFYLSYLLVLILSLPCCGQKENKTPKETTLLERSGIPSKAIGWVSDFEKVFSPAEINILDSIISKHEKKTSNEIAIVTSALDSNLITTPGQFDELSLLLFKKWGVGKKDKDNGVGILLSTQLRKVRIEVGYGLEKKLTDPEAKNIIDSIMTPEFRKGNYYEGIKNGLLAIMKEIQ